MRLRWHFGYFRMSGRQSCSKFAADLPQNLPANVYDPPLSALASGCPIVPPSSSAPPVLNVAPPPSIESHVRSNTPLDYTCAGDCATLNAITITSATNNPTSVTRLEIPRFIWIRIIQHWSSVPFALS